MTLVPKERVIHESHARLQPRATLLSNPHPFMLDTIKLDPEMSMALQQVAIDIFTGITNAGRGFQHALLGVYLSGLQHGSALAVEKMECSDGESRV